MHDGRLIGITGVNCKPAIVALKRGRVTLTRRGTRQTHTRVRGATAPSFTKTPTAVVKTTLSNTASTAHELLPEPDYLYARASARRQNILNVRPKSPVDGDTTRTRAADDNAGTYIAITGN